MKQTELTQLVEEFTEDGTINLEGLNAKINEKFDVLIASKVEKAKTSAYDENINKFIADNGFENIDQYSAFVKNTKAGADELSEKVTRYETELQAVTSERDTLKSQNMEYGYMNKLNGVQEPYRKFVMSETKGLVNDDNDFDTALEGFLADNPQYAVSQEPITTKPPKGALPGVGGTGDAVLDILSKKHNIQLE